MRTGARTLGLGLLSQLLSSATNFFLTVSIARTSSLEEFGRFGLAYSFYLVFVGAVRATTLEPLLVVGPTRSSGDFDSMAASAHRAVSAASAVAMTVGFFSCSLALVLGRSWLWASAALVVSGLLGRVEGIRYVAFARGRAAPAALIDASWLVLLLAVWLAAPGLGLTGLGLFVGWAVCGVLASLWGSRKVHRPSFRWVTDQKRLSAPYIGEYATAMAGAHGLMWAFAAVGGLPLVGILRALQTLFGPLNTLVASLQVVAVPVGARDYRHRVVAFSMGISATVLLAASVWSGGLLIAPSRVLVALLGRSGEEAAAYLPFYVPYVVVGALAIAGMVGLRVLADARATLGCRIVSVCLTLACAIIGFVGTSGSLRGALVGLGAGQLFGAIVWWRGLLSSARRQPIGH